MNNAAINIHTQVSEWTNVSFLLGIFLGVELLGYVVNSVLSFEKLTLFFKAVVYFTFTLAVYEDSSSSPCSPILISDFFTLHILVGVKRYFAVVLICAPLINIKHLFICLTFLSSLEKCPDFLPIIRLGCLFIIEL